MMKENQIAVQVKNATKYYGDKLILDNLCMTVEKGTIYGLLGASGCGKTTLLSCIVGRKNLLAGDVWVLGGTPGTPECGIPGPYVGYMPQDVALVAEFTVEGAVYYFGRIFGMPEEAIEEKFVYLSQLLDLPPRDRFVKNCSGGQQRRISFAAALVNSPKLLILDEPTVGLDPVLREKIWDYLTELCEKEKVAVIITTHYIEETRQAHKIGLMRNGKLLAEESPTVLLNRYNTDSLEEVFLSLSQKQTEGALDQSPMEDVILSPAASTSSVTSIPLQDLNSSIDPLTPEPSTKTPAAMSNSFGVNRYRMKALLGKNVNQIIRNPIGIFFMVLFPILECLGFFFAVGNDVRNIKIALINDENYGDNCQNFIYNDSAISTEDESKCYFKGISCRLLQELNDPMFDLIPYESVEIAKLGVQTGDVGGIIYIPKNFTDSLQDRFNYINNVPSSVLNHSQIQTWLDMSNRQIGPAVKSKLIDKIKDLMAKVFSDCHYSEKAAKLPIRFEKAVYAEYDDSYSIFMTPGVLITIMFFMGSTNTSNIIISDRLEGVWDRSIVAGVSSMEILLSHLLTQFILIVLQTTIVLILTFSIFQVDYLGNYATIFALVVMQGACGMCFGFLVSIISISYSMANIVTTGGFYPMLLLCGMIWPIEGMPTVLQWCSYCTPFTVPIFSLRNLVKKGWDITHIHVLDGFAVSIVWILIFITASLFGIKKKR